MKRNNTMINILFFVGKVVSKCSLKKTSNVIGAEVRLKIESNKEPTYINIIAFGDNATILNNYSEIGNTLYLQCHVSNQICVDINGIAKAKILFVADEIELLYKENKEELKEPDLSILDLLDEIDPITYLEEEK